MNAVETVQQRRNPAALTLLERLAKWYLAQSPAQPPDYYKLPAPLVRAQEEYADEVAGGFLKWFDRARIDLSGLTVLDVGSGYGGRTVRFREMGAARVVGIEIATRTVKAAHDYAQSRGVDTEFLTAVGENLPFSDHSFDLITSYDVFEHVEDLSRTLTECHRVLRPGGSLVAVFPPFFHPTGSHLDGFVSKMPYANLLFPSTTLMRAATALLEERGQDYRPLPLRPGDKLWTLNGITISRFHAIAKQLAFTRARIEHAPLFSPMNSKWVSWKMKYYAFVFAPLRHLPIVRELFVHRIVCVLTK